MHFHIWWVQLGGRCVSRIKNTRLFSVCILEACTECPTGSLLRLTGENNSKIFSTRNVSVSFRLDLIHTPPCHTWVGSTQRIANSAKPRNLSGSAPCSRTLTKGRVNSVILEVMGRSLRLLGHPFSLSVKSQYSSAATVSLTSWSCPCENCLHSHVKWPSDVYSLWLFIPSGLWFLFLPLYSLPGVAPLDCDSAGLAVPETREWKAI